MSSFRYGNYWSSAILCRHVRAWLGPTGTRHDFQWPRLAVESKATSSLRGHIHRISGVEQLEAPEAGALYLFSLGVKRFSQIDATPATWDMDTSFRFSVTRPHKARKGET